MGTGRGGVDGAHVIARKRMQRKVFGLVHEVAVVLLLPVEDLPALEALQRPRVVPKTAQLVSKYISLFFILFMITSSCYLCNNYHFIHFLTLFENYM